MSLVPLDIEAVVELDGTSADDVPTGLATVRGQNAVATTPGHVVDISLVPDQPPACPEAVTSVLEAEWVVLGPGSWFTSVIPHLLVPGLREALVTSSARKVVTLNLEPQAGETDGFSPDTHLEVLLEHAPGLKVDVVLADAGAVADVEHLRATAASFGADLVVADVAADDGSPRHDPGKLANAYASLMRDA